VALAALFTHCAGEEAGSLAGDRNGGFVGGDGIGAGGGVGNGADDCSLDTRTSIQIGPPNTPFEPWEQGDPIPIFLGGEGGADLRYVIKSIGPDSEAEIRTRLVLSNGEVLSDSTTTISMSCHELAYWLSNTLFVGVASDDPLALWGETATLSVEVSFPALGITLTDELTGEITI